MTSCMPTYILPGLSAGWISRHQQAIIEYLRTENEILKRQLHGRRLRLTDEERRRSRAARELVDQTAEFGASSSPQPRPDARK
jgi:hypothetical protein